MDGKAAALKVLAHHGVRGMKWGVRRSRPTGAPVEVSVLAPAGQRVKTSGGQNHPASEDAKRAAAAKQKAKSSTTDSLSNHELQDLIKRMSLEQQYAKLTPPPTGVKAFLQKLLKDTAQSEVQLLAKGQKGPVMKQLDIALATRSGGKHRKP